MNNDTDPKTPEPSENIQIDSQESPRMSPEYSEPEAQPETSEPGNQWQTKEQYKNTQAVESQAPVDTTMISTAYKRAAIFFGISVTFFMLCLLTPLGSLIAIPPDPGMSRPGADAHPLFALSIIAMGLSYLIFLVIGIIKAQRQQKSKAIYITLLVIGVVLVANPIGAFIILLAVSCNLSPCSGT